MDPHWRGAIALDEPTLREVARAPGACLLSAPNDSWSLKRLLEKLAAIMFI
jgi:hypothetical protein